MSDYEWRERGAELILVLGGARSGKSTFAERLALESDLRVAYIATAQAFDDDMSARIAHHRATRPAHWLTIEEPLDLAHALHEAGQQAEVVLLDCLTVWLSNWLFAQEQAGALTESAISSHHYHAALEQITAFLQTLATLPASHKVVVVSNEVGLGIVPAYPLGRVYRDVLGLVNQRVAAAADRVYLLIAGLGVDIKRLHKQAHL